MPPRQGNMYAVVSVSSRLRAEIEQAESVVSHSLLPYCPCRHSGAAIASLMYASRRALLPFENPYLSHHDSTEHQAGDSSNEYIKKTPRVSSFRRARSLLVRGVCLDSRGPTGRVRQADSSGAG